MLNDRKCSVCSKVDKRRPGKQVIIGTHEAARNHVGKCQECGTLFCGACASPKFDVYVNSPTGQEDAEEDSLLAAIQLLSGEEVRETMKEVYEKSGTEIVLSYRCKMCNGEIDF